LDHLPGSAASSITPSVIHRPNSPYSGSRPGPASAPGERRAARARGAAAVKGGGGAAAAHSQCAGSVSVVNGRRKAFVSSENERAIRDRPPHADPLVEGDRRAVLRAHKEAYRGDLREQQPTEVAQRALGVSAVTHARIDPDLLELHGGRRPRRGFGLEADDSL